MMKTKGQQQEQTPRTMSDRTDWPRPRAFPTPRPKSASFGYPSPKQVYLPPTDAERAAEDVERWDGLS